MGEQARPALEQLLSRTEDLEARRRADRLLARLRGPLTASDKLREVRAVHVLEQIGTSAAMDLLRRWEEQAPNTRLGMEAKPALQPLARKR